MSITDFADAMRQLKELAGAEQNDAKAKKKRRIVQAATELFLQHGYRKTSIDDVADRAGIAKGTIYLYFKNKAQLLLQAVAEEKLRAAESWRHVYDKSLKPKERLRLILKTAFLLTGQMPLTWRLTSGDREFMGALDEIDATLHGQVQTMQLEAFAELVAAAAGKKKPTPAMRDRAQVLRGLLLHTAVLVGDQARQGMPQERYAEVLADLLMDGLAAPEGR